MEKQLISWLSAFVFTLSLSAQVGNHIPLSVKMDKKIILSKLNSFLKRQYNESNH